MQPQTKEILFHVDLHSMLIIAQSKHELGMASHMQIILTIAMVASIVFHINSRAGCSAPGENVLLL